MAVVWLLLAGTGSEALALGALVVPAAALLGHRLLPGGRAIRFWPAMALVPKFLVQSVLGGLDVARRAFDPRLPLNPGWIELRVTLPAGGRVTLGGGLSLMPGTLAAGSSGDRLLVHVLDKDRDIEADIREDERQLAQAIGPETGPALTDEGGA